MKGVLIRVILTKGYAFARGEDGREYFIHARAFMANDPTAWDSGKIREGASVEFTPREDGRGGNGLHATEVLLK
jgi:cold shock CspA family protein